MFSSLRSFIGFGTWGIEHDHLQATINAALASGYEHFDTAATYGNEDIVGRTLAGSGKPRSTFAITTKISRADVENRKMLEGAKRSRDRLLTEKVDLVLAHWPPRERSIASCVEDLVSIKHAGITAEVGVSNFTYAQLSQLPADLLAEICCVQSEYHPYLAQTELEGLCFRHKKRFAAYSPLSRGRILCEPVLKNMANKYSKSVPQIVLRWHFQSNRSVIVRSSRADAIKENIDIFDFELENTELQTINALTAISARVVSPAWAPSWDN